MRNKEEKTTQKKISSYSFKGIPPQKEIEEAHSKTCVCQKKGKLQSGTAFRILTWYRYSFKKITLTCPVHSGI